MTPQTLPSPLRSASVCARIALVAGGCLLLASAGGCASQSQLAKIQSEKEQLKALVESEKRLNEKLAAQLQSASQRVAEAERELALAAGGKPVAKPHLVNTQLPAANARAPLDQWAVGQPLLKYDPSTRTARVKVVLTFNTSGQLTIEGRRELDQVADLLLSRSGARCGVRIFGIEASSGDPQAAQRVAATTKYLGLRGIPSDRIEVSSKVSPQLIDEEGRKLASTAGSGVELELFERTTAGESVANEPSGKSGDGWTRSPGRRR
jgi:hypothetical protein